MRAYLKNGITVVLEHFTASVEDLARLVDMQARQPEAPVHVTGFKTQTIEIRELDLDMRTLAELNPTAAFCDEW